MKRICLCVLGLIYSLVGMAFGQIDNEFGHKGVATTEFFANQFEPGNAQEVAIQRDGKIVVATADGYVYRFSPNGLVDQSFGVDGKVQFIGNGYSILVQDDQRIVVAGPVYDGTKNKVGIARYESNGSLDSTFGSEGKKVFSFFPAVDNDQSVNRVLLQNDGKLLVVGSEPNGKVALARLHNDGEFDNDFGVSGRVLESFEGTDFAIKDAKITGGGNIVVCGSSQRPFFNDLDFAILKLTNDGVADNSFANNGKLSIDLGGNESGECLAVFLDESIAFSGYSSTDKELVIVKIKTDGTIDGAFGQNGVVRTGLNLYPNNSVCVQSQLMVGGEFNNGDNSEDFGLVRLNSDGSFDSQFDSDGFVQTDFSNANNRIHDFELLEDGRILATGSSFRDFAGFPMARYLSNGQLDDTFGIDGRQSTKLARSWDVATAAVSSGEANFFVGGHSTAPSDFTNGHTNFSIARYDLHGSLDGSFSGDGRANISFGEGSDKLLALVVQDDGKLIAVGSHDNGEDLDFAIARLNLDGSLDSSFGTNGTVVTSVGPSGDDCAYSVRLQDDQKIVVAGFCTVSGSKRFAVVRLNPDGTFDNSFNNDGKAITYTSGTNSVAFDVAIQADGKVVLVGKSEFNGEADFAINRLMPDGTIDPFFGNRSIDIQGADFAYEVNVHENSKILIAGISNSETVSLTRLLPNGQIDNSYGTLGVVKHSLSFDVSETLASSIHLYETGVLVTGNSFNGRNKDFCLTNLDVDGSTNSTLGSSFSFPLGLSNDQANAVCMAGNGDVLVVGEVAFLNSDIGRDFGVGKIKLHLRGDMNGDGALSNEDIGPFVLALTSPSMYQAMYPELDADSLGDFNEDGQLTNADISGFIDALLGG